MMLVAMRTTMSVDDDLLQLAKQRALDYAVPVSDVINRALRRGLSEDPTPRLGEATVTYGDSSAAGPDDAALRSASARLDDDELARKLRS